MISELAAELWKSAAAVLDANWVDDHTVPSHALHPHQWSWDTGFAAIGLAYVNQGRAWRDLRSLFEAQWPDGRVPHIVFDPATAEDDYFPGPAFWNVPAYGRRPARGSSGLVQPPVHALAAWEVYRHAAAHGAASAQQARTELEWLYPRLVAAQRYFTDRRDAGGAGLAAIVHPWESGLDNSPAWDSPLAAVPADLGLLSRYHGRNPGVAAPNVANAEAAGAAEAADRATGASRVWISGLYGGENPHTDYARCLGLAVAYRDGGYSDTDLVERHGFVVECPGFNAILATAELALAQIAGVLGKPERARWHREAARRITGAIAERLWEPRTRTFHARDVRTGRLSPARCVNGLLPLMLPDLPEHQAGAIMAEAASERFGLPALGQGRATCDSGPAAPGQEQSTSGSETGGPGRERIDPRSETGAPDRERIDAGSETGGPGQEQRASGSETGGPGRGRIGPGSETGGAGRERNDPGLETGGAGRGWNASGLGLPVPGHDRTGVGFDARGAWRGSVWVNVNWLLRRGMLVHGFHAEAEELRRAMLRLVHRGGHYEYFDAEDGSGLGAAAFTGTAALCLDLLADRSVPVYAHGSAAASGRDLRPAVAAEA
ncbi:hypothetical protein AB0M02_09410 [Actinoplanes sp. NPDC051861]|uniref:MGH1-like glycoside hydrolase domain-containing protein n=1 Tax=Actinoplanes sp. NPDC051861 TaxID=3155170 RepID=UPI00343D3DA2